MKRLNLLLLLVLGLFMGAANAQTRYLQPVFDNITADANVTYGVNATVLYYSVFNQAVPEPLRMDVYRPASDTETKRPLVLVLHTGNFLPFFNPAPPNQGGFNGACGGTRQDSSIVEYCKRLAKMGYVAAAVSYRLGWNPLAATDVERRYGIINAAYRGVQDTRTAIRYFKKSVVEAGNPWGIDTSRIVVWGQGTGGYVSLATMTLDNYLKIPTAPGGKFIWDHDQNPATNPIPMIIPQVNGDINGTSVGQVPNPAATNGIDTLNYPNHVGYTSNYQLTVNLAGACADSSWVDPGQTPLISFQVPYDNFAPYGEGIVNVPGTNLQVVTVQGSYVIQHLAEDFGNQNSFLGQPIYTANHDDAFAKSPAGFKDKAAGLYPFNNAYTIVNGVPIPETTSPWEWTSFVPTAPATCNNDRGKAIPYIDTIFNFYAPRACFALGLQGCVDKILSEKEPIAPASIRLTAAPNPASDVVTFTSEADQPMQRMELYNAYGQVVRTAHDINSSSFVLQRNGLPAGNYVVKMSFREGFRSQMVSFQ